MKKIWTVLRSIDSVLERSWHYHVGKRSRYPLVGMLCAAVALQIVLSYGMFAAFAVQSIALNFGVSAPLSDSAAVCAGLFAMYISVLIFQYMLGCYVAAWML